MSVGKLFFKAYLWNMLGKFVIRGMGIISTLILVRVLSPDDFGLIAMATIFIGLFQVLTNAGINRYLLLRNEVSDEDFDAAWTLNLGLRFVALIVTLAISPWLAGFMGNPDLAFVIQAISLTSFIAAFNSVGLIQYEKDLNFAPINKIEISAKVCAVIVTISAAFYFRSYYALLIGNGILSSVALVMSYLVTKRKPRLVWKIEKAMFTFASQMMLRNLIGYSRSQIDILIVGKKFGDTALGEFSIARQFAILPQTEIITPAMQPTFSVMSSLKDQGEHFIDKVYQSLFLIYCFVIPAATGLYFLADPFVQVVLGSQWLKVIDYIGLLAFLMLPFATQPILNTVYDAAGKTHLSMFADLFGLVAIVCMVLYFVPLDVAVFAEYRILVGILALLFSMFLARVFVGLRFRRFLMVLCLPLSLSLAMYFILNTLSVSFEQAILTLLANALIGAVFYVASLLICVRLIVRSVKGKVFSNNVPFALLQLLERISLKRMFK